MLTPWCCGNSTTLREPPIDMGPTSFHQNATQCSCRNATGWSSSMDVIWFSNVAPAQMKLNAWLGGCKTSKGARHLSWSIWKLYEAHSRQVGAWACDIQKIGTRLEKKIEGMKSDKNIVWVRKRFYHQFLPVSPTQCGGFVRVSLTPKKIALTKLRICFCWCFFIVYHGKSPSNHHLGEQIFGSLFPSASSSVANPRKPTAPSIHPPSFKGKFAVRCLCWVV